MKWVAILFGCLWVAGWVATLYETSPRVDAKLWQRIIGPLALFFLWPMIPGRRNT